jgi:hypothetical protein
LNRRSAALKVERSAALKVERTAALKDKSYFAIETINREKRYKYPILTGKTPERLHMSNFYRIFALESCEKVFIQQLI